MPSGLTNALATFQDWMNELLSVFLDLTVLTYLDDMLIYSDDPLSHVTHVRQVLKKINDTGVNLKAFKCHFHQDQVEYLRFIDSRQGVFIDPKKIQAVTKWPDLANGHDVQCLLGFVNFNHRIMKSYSNICNGIFALFKKEEKFMFNDKAKAAFQRLKTAFISTPILDQFDVAKRITVEIETSNHIYATISS